MGKLFSLDADTKSVIQDALDDLITEFGKDCRLVYPPRMRACSNCPRVGGQPTSIWRTGEPQPFTASVCPLCGGTGKIADEKTETIHLSLQWDPKKFWRPLAAEINLRLPFSVCQTKGYLTDLPKLKMCDHVILQTPVEGIVRKKFKLLGEPGDPSNIIQNRYCVATWEQVG
jgi:hypothetical protein